MQTRDEGKFVLDEYEGLYRRRIEQAEQGGASTATAPEVTNEKGSGEWTDELIRLCGIMQFIPECEYEVHQEKIKEHLAKRGDK